MLKRLFFDSFAYSVPTIVSRSLSFVLIPIYSKFLSPSDFGNFDLLMTFVALANVVVSFEIIQGFARFLGEPEMSNYKSKLISTTFWFRVICFSLFFGICFVNSEKMSFTFFRNSNLDFEFKMSLIYLFLNSILYSLQSFLRWSLNSTLFNISSVVQVTITALSTVFFLTVKQETVNGLFSGLICGSFFGIIFCLPATIKNLNLNFDLPILKELLSFSWPLTFSSLGIWVNLYVDRYLLNYFLGPHDVGLYGLAARIAGVGLLLAGGFQFALTPLIYANYQNSETPKKLNIIFNFFYVISLIFFFCVILFGKEVIRLISTDQFLNSQKLLIYLVPALLINNMSIFTPGIELAKKTKVLTYINITSCACNFLMNIVLIPKIAAEGAALATLLSAIITMFLYNYFSQKFYKIQFKFLKKIIVFLLLFISVYFLQGANLHLITRMILSLVFVFICIFIQKNSLFKVKTLVKN